MSRDLIEQKEFGDYRLSIYYDWDAECPVTSWDMAACYLFEYTDSRTHRLHSDCDWKELFSDSNHSLEEALRYLAAKHVHQDDIIKHYKAGKFTGWRFEYDRSSRVWRLQYQCNYGQYKGEWYTELEVEPCDLKALDYRDELLENLDSDDLIELIDTYAKDIVIKKWGSCGYCQGDYLDGIAYITKERYSKMVAPLEEDWRERSLKLIDAEVKEIGIWAWGDVKGYVLEKKVYFTKEYDDPDRDPEDSFEWEEVDSCWGFYMETEELIDEALLQNGLKETA